jgi:hypothetical protein
MLEKGMSIRYALEDIKEKQLLQLKEEQAFEAQTLEFKADVNFKEEEAIAEFLRDVSSIANADGGDLLIGMSEDGQGRAKLLSATKYSDLEEFENRIRRFCENHLDPPVVSLRFHPVPLSKGGHAVVLRIDQGWAGPHMVTYKDEYRFFVRRGRSKEKMNIDEIRRRFLLSDTAVRRMKAFRQDRVHSLEDVLDRSGPPRHLVFMLHALPLSAFGRGSAIDVSILSRDESLLAFPDKMPLSVAYNFDGIQARLQAHEGVVPRTVQYFRNACVELIDGTHDMRRKPHKTVEPGYIESLVLDFLKQFIAAFRKLRIEPPIFIGLSLLQTAGYQLDLPPGERHPNARAIDRSRLIFPEVRMDDFGQPLSARMRETFDVFWQSFAYERCRLYDVEGNMTNTVAPM